MSSEMKSIQRTFSGAPWEKKVGYCRAIRMGNAVAVSGTLGIDAQGEPAEGAYLQAKRSLEIIEEAICQLGATRQNIIRTRMFVTDARLWADFGRAHREFFGEHVPATSMIEIKSLIDPRYLIEIEADAYV
jgi:enamine deaminase RidA (YjgF/YER057c/UK114 family)